MVGQRVSSAPDHSTEGSNQRFSSRRLARALGLSFDTTLYICCYLPSACLGCLRGWWCGSGGGGGSPAGEAIDVFDVLDNPNTPRALDYRGYATRKLDAPTKGLDTISSRFVRSQLPAGREYLGEAYVIKNNYELAREQLSAIESSALRTVSITGI
jgi:hypothetical protein